MWQLTYLAAAALLILGQTLLDNTQNVWIDVYTLNTIVVCGHFDSVDNVDIATHYTI